MVLAASVAAAHEQPAFRADRWLLGLRVDSKRTWSKRPRGLYSQTLINSTTASANASGSSCGRL
jgi:hypothetical protein